ncbi:MAG TPA: hypothetical protein VK929_05465 [Longimicrobiales bacterium]|nr:hypothetical protein [Longimicrobiales bacterium]
MRRAALAIFGTAAALTLIMAPPIGAQEPGAGTVDVFLDCQTRGCDSSHFRNEIRFVNWVRDRTAADVHLLITSQGAGGGGSVYQLAFLGLGSFAADSITSRLTVGQTTTDAERRDLLTSRIAQGLLYYARNSAAADRIRVVYDDAGGGLQSPVEVVDDPWNFWVFSVRGNASMNGESREQSRQLELSGSASRITADWKLEFDVGGGYEEDRRELTDRTVTRITKDYEAEALVAKTLAALWSVGLDVSAGRSTFRNQELYTRVATLLEYSVLPYDEYSRRRILLRYTAGVRHFDYEELTIYDQLSEQRADQQLELLTNFQQPWGSARVSLSGAHYFHDLSRYNVTVNGGLDLRLLRGLTLDLSGFYSRVHDQLYIPKGDADDEDVLLRRRALETNYRYRTSIGLRYTFGSIYNNVVNPRLNQGRF